LCGAGPAPLIHHAQGKEDIMKTTTLGKTGLGVSRIAFGTWQLGGDWGATDEDAAVSAIQRAADGGVTLFDTAQGYGFGASEQLLAKALRGRRRQELVIATKGGLRPSGSGVARDASPLGSARASTRACGPSTPTTSTSIRFTGLTRIRPSRTRPTPWPRR
jgi:hypothetical protein